MTTDDDPKGTLPPSDSDAKPATVDAQDVDSSAAQANSVETGSVDITPADAQASEAQAATGTAGDVSPHEKAADKGITAKPTPSKPGTNEKPKGKRATVPLIIVALLLLLLLAGFVAAGYLGWEKYSALAQQIKTGERTLAQQNQTLASVGSQLNAMQAGYSADKQALSQELQAVQQRLTAQTKRLLSLSTTSREDWLLAEAEYLLKLANQRVLIERDGSTADGLLTEADHILRELDDPDLNPIRQAIARDLATLRLMQTIDTEGVYFSLVALLEQVANIPFIPTRQQRNGVSLANAKSSTETGDLEFSSAEPRNVPTLWRERMLASFRSFVAQLDNYIRITKNDAAPTKIIAPQERDYVEQNTRMMILRAQIALLQQKTTIYQQSLTQAQSWVAEFYPVSTQANAFIDELAALGKRDIAQSAPDITASLELLRTYIERLHKLAGTGANARAVNGGKQ